MLSSGYTPRSGLLALLDLLHLLLLPVQLVLLHGRKGVLFQRFQVAAHRADAAALVAVGVILGQLGVLVAVVAVARRSPLLSAPSVPMGSTSSFVVACCSSSPVDIAGSPRSQMFVTCVCLATKVYIYVYTDAFTI